MMPDLERVILIGLQILILIFVATLILLGGWVLLNIAIGMAWERC